MCISYKHRRRHAALAAAQAMQEKQKLADLFEATVIDSKEHSNQRHATHYIQHDYHDHSEEVISEDMKDPPISRGGVKTPFPLKLHEMLDEIEKDGYAKVISWQPHGRAFVVHEPKEFERHVMPLYFNQSKFSSFQRQLNLYGFNRITKGLDKGGYYHELFLRGKRPLTRRIPRKKVKGTFVRGRSSPESEPNFYVMPFIGRDGAIVPNEADWNHDCQDSRNGSHCGPSASSTESATRSPIRHDDDTVTTAEETASCGSSDGGMPIGDGCNTEAAAVRESDLRLAMNRIKLNVEDATGFNHTVPIVTTIVDLTPSPSANGCKSMEPECDDDDTLTFEGKTFHYLDPADLDEMKVVGEDQVFGDDQSLLSPNELDHFLGSLKISRALYDDILTTMEDDTNFGNLLEKVIE